MSTESNEAPKISVVIAVLDGAETLQQCVDSVTVQTYPNKELVILDGGSTDGTVQVLEANKDNIAYWESTPDRGLAHAWNKALGKVKGAWVIFLGADDYLVDSTVLEDMSSHLRNTDCLVYGRVLLRGGTWDGTILGESWNWKKFRRRMTVPHTGAFHSIRLFSEVGTYDESQRIALDYELLLRLGEKLSSVFVDRLVTSMFAGGVSMNSRGAALAESRKAQTKHKVAPPVLIYSWYLYFRIRILFEKTMNILRHRWSS